MHPQRAEARVGGQGRTDLLGGRLRQQHLAPVPGSEKAGHTVEGRAEVVPLPHLRLPGVHRHPHPKPRHFPLQHPLRLDRRLHRVRGGTKHGAELIADGLEDVTVVRDDGRAEQRVVAGEGIPHRGGLLFPEAGAALDVGEEKGDGAGRDLTHVLFPTGNGCAHSAGFR
jgi:hypothetical protein